MMPLQILCIFSPYANEPLEPTFTPQGSVQMYANMYDLREGGPSIRTLERG